MDASADDILRRIREAFREDASRTPTITLRGGNAIDDYARPAPYDPDVDAVTDEYLQRYAYYACSHLDPESWRHYLPRLAEYALAHPRDDHMVAHGLIASLRPPDRDPPRLGSLTVEQEDALRALLEHLAFCVIPGGDEFVMQVLEEWWLPDALYRPPGKRGS